MCISCADEPAKRRSIFRSCWFFCRKHKLCTIQRSGSATQPGLCLNEGAARLYKTCLAPTFSSHFYKPRHLHPRGFSPTSRRSSDCLFFSQRELFIFLLQCGAITFNEAGVIRSVWPKEKEKNQIFSFPINVGGQTWRYTPKCIILSFTLLKYCNVIQRFEKYMYVNEIRMINSA